MSNAAVNQGGTAELSARSEKKIKKAQALQAKIDALIEQYEAERDAKIAVIEDIIKVSTGKKRRKLYHKIDLITRDTKNACNAIRETKGYKVDVLLGKKSRWKEVKKNWQLYLFLLLPLIWITIFHYIPMPGVVIAFKKYNFKDGIFGSPWVGFDNFVKFFQYYRFARIIGNTLFLSLYSLFASFPIPVIFALILNSMRSEKFKKVTQTITYMPHFISVVVLVGMLVQMLNPRIGIYGTIYSYFNNGAFPSKDLLADSGLFKHLYVWSGVWQTFGWNSIIYTAALAGVSPDLHEAAEIDGASRLQRVIHIDLPTIMPTIIIMLIMRMGHVMSLGFEKIYLLQRQTNLSTSEVISTYVYKEGLANQPPNYSYSTAVSLFNSLINLTLITTVNWVSSKVSDTSLW